MRMMMLHSIWDGKLIVFVCSNHSTTLLVCSLPTGNLIKYSEQFGCQWEHQQSLSLGPGKNGTWTKQKEKKGRVLFRLRDLRETGAGLIGCTRDSGQCSRMHWCQSFGVFKHDTFSTPTKKKKSKKQSFFVLQQKWLLFLFVCKSKLGSYMRTSEKSTIFPHNLRGNFHWISSSMLSLHMHESPFTHMLAWTSFDLNLFAFVCFKQNPARLDLHWVHKFCFVWVWTRWHVPRRGTIPRRWVWMKWQRNISKWAQCNTTAAAWRCTSGTGEVELWPRIWWKWCLKTNRVPSNEGTHRSMATQHKWSMLAVQHITSHDIQKWHRMGPSGQ